MELTGFSEAVSSIYDHLYLEQKNSSPKIEPKMAEIEGAIGRQFQLVSYIQDIVTE